MYGVERENENAVRDSFFVGPSKSIHRSRSESEPRITSQGDLGTPLVVPPVPATGSDPIQTAMRFPVPDGSGSLRYPAPSLNLFMFDQSSGLHFDPFTGLHYDGSCGYFINSNLNIILRWDAAEQTYLHVGHLGVAKLSVQQPDIHVGEGDSKMSTAVENGRCPPAPIISGLGEMGFDDHSGKSKTWSADQKRARSPSWSLHGGRHRRSRSSDARRQERESENRNRWSGQSSRERSSTKHKTPLKEQRRSRGRTLSREQRQARHRTPSRERHLSKPGTPSREQRQARHRTPSREHSRSRHRTASRIRDSAADCGRRVARSPIRRQGRTVSKRCSRDRNEQRNTSNDRGQNHQKASSRVNCSRGRNEQWNTSNDQGQYHQIASSRVNCRSRERSTDRRLLIGKVPGKFSHRGEQSSEPKLDDSLKGITITTEKNDVAVLTSSQTGDISVAEVSSSSDILCSSNVSYPKKRAASPVPCSSGSSKPLRNEPVPELQEKFPFENLLRKAAPTDQLLIVSECYKHPDFSIEKSPLEAQYKENCQMVFQSCRFSGQNFNPDFIFMDGFWSRSLGNPFPYGLSTFPTKEDAKAWFERFTPNCELLYNDDLFYIFYVHKPWVCPFCQKPNFFLRHMCFHCGRLKHNGLSPIKHSKEPSWICLHQMETSFDTTKIEEWLIKNKVRFRSVKVIKDPWTLQSSGIVIVEPFIGIVDITWEKLQECLPSNSKSYVYVHSTAFCDCRLESIETVPDEELPDASLLRVVSEKVFATVPSSSAFVLVAPLPTSQAKGKCPVNIVDSLKNALEEGSVLPASSIKKLDIYDKDYYGAPFHYALITLAGPIPPACKDGLITLKYGHWFDEKLQECHTFVSLGNWYCKFCKLSNNFPLRTICVDCGRAKQKPVF